MRGSFRHLWAMLGFLVPLALLGWWATAELGRRSRQVLEQAGQTVATALDGPVDAVTRQLDDAFARADPAALRLAERGATLAAAELGRSWPALRHLALLDDAGRLLHPTRARRGPLPLARPATAQALVAAEAALAMDRPDQGERYLRAFLTEHEVASPVDLRAEVRARFWLGTILRRRGALDDALQSYQDVLDWTALAEAFPGPGAGAPLPDLGLLAQAAIAEIRGAGRPGAAGETGGSAEPALALLSDIAQGNRDGLDEAILQAVWDRMELCAIQAGGDPEALGLRAQERARRAGRAFAAAMGPDFEAAARRHLRSPQAQGRWIEVLHRDEPGLMLLRPAGPGERAATGAAWVGLHVDAVLTLAAALGPFVAGPASASSAAGIQVAATDRDGLGFLPGAMPEAAAVGAGRPTAAGQGSRPTTPLISTRPLDIPGLALVAAADPGQWLAEARAQNRTEAALVLGMFLAALGGAFWLWRSVSRAEELAALKVELMSRVSHELKTPLALVRMYAETLALDRARDAEERRRFGGIIARESDRLSILLERVLNFSRRRAGLLTYRLEPGDLSDLVARTVGAWQPHAEKLGARVAMQVEPGIHLPIDPAGLGSALLNLLDNAVKFTPEDRRDEPILVQLRRTGPAVELAVHDRGIGIPPKDRKRVFRAFHRGRNAANIGGAGLGLEMVAHCCRAHGARVSAHSRPQGGTTVAITWPDPQPGTTAQPPA